MTGSLSQGTATSTGEYLHVSQPVCLFLSQFVILSLSDFLVFFSSFFYSTQHSLYVTHSFSGCWMKNVKELQETNRDILTEIQLDMLYVPVTV